MANCIRAERRPTEHVSEPHLVLIVDGEPLDALIHGHYPEKNCLGLAPTLLDWLDDPREHDLVWRRILPPAGQRRNAPILMCPDDLDLWCTVVIADVESTSDEILWHRLGMDAGGGGPMPESVGTSVDWWDGIGPFAFDRNDYLKCLSAFRSAPASSRG